MIDNQKRTKVLKNVTKSVHALTNVFLSPYHMYYHLKGYIVNPTDMRRKTTDINHHHEANESSIFFFLICIYGLSFPRCGVPEISIGLGEDKAFYHSGIGSFQMGDFGRQIVLQKQGINKTSCSSQPP